MRNRPDAAIRKSRQKKMDIGDLGIVRLFPREEDPDDIALIS